jgi:hypothetical protein
MKAQIWMLNQEQLKTWIANPSSIRILEHISEPILNYTELEWMLIKLHTQIIIQTNHYNFELIDNFLSLSDKDLRREFKNIYGNNYKSMLLNCIDTILFFKDTEKAKKIISRIKSLKDILLTDEKDKIIITELGQKLYSKNPETEILFTTFFDNPKLTLIVNNLIKNASCFNYNNWAEIQALISYVKDANIKGIVGLIISSSDVPNFSDFQNICKSIKISPEKVAYNFEPEKMILHIIINNKVFDINIQNVYYKRFVKIWKTIDGGLWMCLEKAHKQDNRMINVIEEEAVSLFIYQANKIWAQTNKPICIPDSRSTLWSYSDIAVGRKLWPYIMPID